MDMESLNIKVYVVSKIRIKTQVSLLSGIKTLIFLICVFNSIYQRTS
jgi:hypothetical protein